MDERRHVGACLGVGWPFGVADRSETSHDTETKGACCRLHGPRFVSVFSKFASHEQANSMRASGSAEASEEKTREGANRAGACRGRKMPWHGGERWPRRQAKIAAYVTRLGKAGRRRS